MKVEYYDHLTSSLEERMEAAKYGYKNCEHRNSSSETVWVDREVEDPQDNYKGQPSYLHVNVCNECGRNIFLKIIFLK